jgi:hypothetical protein
MNFSFKVTILLVFFFVISFDKKLRSEFSIHHIVISLYSNITHVIFVDMCIESEARLGGIIDLGCLKICHIKEGSICLNN